MNYPMAMPDWRIIISLYIFIHGNAAVAGQAGVLPPQKQVRIRSDLEGGDKSSLSGSASLQTRKHLALKHGHGPQGKSAIIAQGTTGGHSHRPAEHRARHRPGRSEARYRQISAQRSRPRGQGVRSGGRDEGGRLREAAFGEGRPTAPFLHRFGLRGQSDGCWQIFL